MKDFPQILVLVTLITFSITNNVAESGNLACGDVITSNVTLDADLVCANDDDGLIIERVNITLDLGAHTIEGPSTFPAITTSGVRISSGSQRVIVKNGIIAGFDQGVSAYDVRNVDVHGYHRGLSIDCNSGNCYESPWTASGG